MAKCKCHFRNRDAVPVFVVQGNRELTELDNKYATVQFVRTMGVSYGATSRSFKTTEVVALPYPVIHDLLQVKPAPIAFRNSNEEMTFNQIYGNN